MTSVRSRLCLLLALSLAASTAHGETARWSELHYEVSKLTFSARSMVRLDRLESAELERALVQPAKGEWLGSGGLPGWALSLASDGLGRRSRLELLIDSRGNALQRTQTEIGRRLKDNHHRLHRFSRQAAFISTDKPRAGEIDSVPESWSLRSEWLKPFDVELPPDAVVGQPTGLFELLTRAPLNQPGDRVSCFVFSKNEVIELELTADAWESVEVNFIEVVGGVEKRREQQIRALVLKLDGKAVSADAKDSDFKFLGLGGKVAIYLDPSTRAPLLVTGNIAKIGPFGRARVKLTKLVVGES